MITVSAFKPYGLNRAQSVMERVGGKGINVARQVKRMGGNVMAFGLIGGETGSRIEMTLQEEGIRTRFVRVAGATRTNIKVVDALNHAVTEINETGNAVTEEDLRSLEKELTEAICVNDVVVFSGSAPKGTPSDIYAKWIRLCKEKGAKTILDADGALLIEGLKAAPTAVKPNTDELSRIMNQVMQSPDEARVLSERLLDYGVEMVLLSQGEIGAHMATRDGTWTAPAPEVRVISTVGAGDSMVAAMAMGIDNGDAAQTILQAATEAAAAWISGAMSK